MRLRKFVTDEGFTDQAPETLVNNSWVYPPLQTVLASFRRLSRGRSFGQMGHPFPITYRDIADELQRCPWPHKTQLEKWLTAMDDEFLDIAAKAAGDK